MLVRLTTGLVRGHQCHEAGEVLDVDEARAARLLAAGIAERVDQPDKPPAAAVVETAAVAFPQSAETAVDRTGGRRRGRKGHN